MMMTSLTLFPGGARAHSSDEIFPDDGTNMAFYGFFPHNH